jgi:hypothetical protein
LPLYTPSIGRTDGRALSTPIKTNFGSSQDDFLSPVVLVVYLKLAMREIRTACSRLSVDVDIPSEIIYADHTDFCSKSASVIAEVEIKTHTSRDQ